MEQKEPDSRYLTLWLCVFLTVGIVFVGWFVALRQNFNKINKDMNGNVTQTFEEAQQDVLDSFGEVEAILAEGEDKLKAAVAVEAEAEAAKKAGETPVVIEKTETAPAVK